MTTNEALALKEDETWKFSARYVNGMVSFLLTSKSDGRQYPEQHIFLDEKEWDRLVTWIDYQRAEDAIAK